MAHWNKNANLGNTFDQWFLNLFPRTKPFVDNEGGYLTLSFIPTLGTMVLGLTAGRWLPADAARIPLRRFLIAGVTGVALGILLHVAGICPVVKRIWTPSWTLFRSLLPDACRFRLSHRGQRLSKMGFSTSC
jgi:heparan-alpha-glucosaminide N-acetyltransferase